MKFNFTEEEFIEYYKEHTYKEIQDRFKINSNQVMYLRDYFKLPSKKKGRRKEVPEFL